MNLDLFKSLILFLAGIYILLEARKDLKRGYFHWDWGGTVYRKREPKGFHLSIYINIFLALFLMVLGIVSFILEIIS